MAAAVRVHDSDLLSAPDVELVVPDPNDFVSGGDELQRQLAVDDGVRPRNGTAWLRFQKRIALRLAHADSSEIQISNPAERGARYRFGEEYLALAVFGNAVHFLVAGFVLACLSVYRDAQNGTASVLLNVSACGDFRGIR